MTSAVVAYDLGRTNCRGALVVDGERVDVAAEPTQATVIDRGGEEAVVDAVRRLSGRLDPPPLEGVCLGLTGFHQASAAAGRLGGLIRELHGDVRSVVTSDVTIAHAGALGGRSGVVVLAGTGAGVLGVCSAGERVQVDGWGHLLGDAGSGFDIGRAGLAAALAYRDGRGTRTALVELAEDRFGPLEALPARLHRSANPARLVASFAEAVADAARAGDDVASGIWLHAATTLARSAAAGVERLLAAARASDAPSVAVSWAGGLFASGDLLLDPFCEQLRRLAPAGVLTPPEGDPLDGAVLLARDPRTCHEPALRLPARGDRSTDDDRTGRCVVSQMGEG